MAQKENREQEKSLLFNSIPEDFAATAKKRIEEFAGAQSELFDQCQNASRHWLDRIQAEANVASEFATKLTAVRSIPEAMIACQEWNSRRLEVISDDARHLLDDAQKFMQAWARLIANGGQSKGSGAST